MPTGYTDGVGKGEITTFKDYAELCLRSRGVAITIRDEPMDVRVPDKIEDDYYVRAFRRAAEALAAAEALEGDALNQACYRANNDAKVANLKRKQEKALTKMRYEAMLEAARAWESPTPEHDDLKNFMVSQLEESIDFDCSTVYLEDEDLTPAEYKTATVHDAERHLVFAWKLLVEMTQKFEDSTEYIRAFRASL